uniref:DH domain-containing protein n=2 Tax=Eptatretus burgeri TaxID=7764 RepID=A0A8C4NNJ3_EPTBU
MRGIPVPLTVVQTEHEQNDEVGERRHIGVEEHAHRNQEGGKLLQYPAEPGRNADSVSGLEKQQRRNLEAYVTSMELQQVEHEKPFDGPTMLSIGNGGPPMLGIRGERFSLDSSSLSSRDSVASSPTRPQSPRHGADSGYSAGEASDREWSELPPIHLRTSQSGRAINLVESAGAEMHHISWSSQNVALELLDTERAYVKDLRSLTEGYLYNLRQAAEFRSKKDKLSTVFSNIEKIFDFNRNLLDTLEGCNLDPVCISECFINKVI